MSIYSQVKSIFFNWELTPIFGLKGSVFHHQNYFRVIVCLESWRYQQGMLSVNFRKTDSRECNLYLKVKAPNTLFAQLLGDVSDT